MFDLAKIVDFKNNKWGMRAFTSWPMRALEQHYQHFLGPYLSVFGSKIKSKTLKKNTNGS